MKDAFTLGIEQEFQIIDPNTRELRSAISQMMEANELLSEMSDIEFQRELHQSVVEVASGICANIQEARADVVRDRAAAARLARAAKAEIAAASTHPFSKWWDQEISEGDRYATLVGELQDVARANVIYGMHVHVGIEDREEAVAVFNSARYFLPHLLALSSSSPFFNGRDTGMASVRSLIFKRMPRTGIPETFKSFKEYEQLIDLLVNTGCIDSQRRVWWDLRLHPIYNTIEYRVCDLPPLVDEVMAIAALFQALTARLMRMHRDNQQWRHYPSALIEENKWRAVRYGTKGKMIDFGRQKEVPVRDLIYELLEFVDEVVDYLGCREDLEYLETMLNNGTSADRQRAVYQETGSLEAVVDHVLEETMQGVGDAE
jgi:carboxylate-amine ligase